jgi:AraC family transcriptional activator of pobA
MLHLRLLVEAERQLRYTTMSIAQIAYHLGFEDPAYFSRFFARHAQLAPRLFRSRDGAAGEPMH